MLLVLWFGDGFFEWIVVGRCKFGSLMMFCGVGFGVLFKGDLWCLFVESLFSCVMVLVLFCVGFKWDEVKCLLFCFGFRFIGGFYVFGIWYI